VAHLSRTCGEWRTIRPGRWGSRIVVKDTGILLNNDMRTFNLFPGVTEAKGNIGTAANAGLLCAPFTLVMAQNAAVTSDANQGNDTLQNATGPYEDMVGPALSGNDSGIAKLLADADEQAAAVKKVLPPTGTIEMLNSTTTMVCGRAEELAFKNRSASVGQVYFDSLIQRIHSMM
jgi:hypothetical protein